MCNRTDSVLGHSDWLSRKAARRAACSVLPPSVLASGFRPGRVAMRLSRNRGLVAVQDRSWLLCWPAGPAQDQLDPREQLRAERPDLRELLTALSGIGCHPYRRQCARCSRRGLITQRYENRSTSVSSPCRIFAFENQLLETGSAARPTPRPRPTQPGTLEPRDRPPHRRRRHLPRPRGPDPPRRCSPSRTTRRMDLRCAATSASTSSPRAG